MIHAETKREKPEAVKDFALVKDEIVKLLTEQKALQLGVLVFG